MTEQRTSVIEVGDVVTTAGGYQLAIHTVIVGRHGLLVMGHWPEGDEGGMYCPMELHAGTEAEMPWQGFAGRSWVELVSGHKIGMVAFSHRDERRYNAEAYDTEWAKTPSKMQSRPVNIRMG